PSRWGWWAEWPAPTLWESPPRCLPGGRAPRGAGCGRSSWRCWWSPPRPAPGSLASRPRPPAPPAPQPRPGAPAVQAPWLRELPPAQRDVARATALAQDGDNLYLAGDRNLARSKYLQAFELNPTPALALKLGMLAHLRGAAGEAEARGFLARALRDAPGTPAASVVKSWYPDLEPAAPPARSAGRSN